MKMEFTIKVEIGVTPELSSILSGFMPMGQLKRSAEDVTPVEQKEVKAEHKKEPKYEAPAVVAETKPEKKEEKQVEQQQTNSGKEVKTYTEEDIRNAMHRCRVRIEGADYKENTTTQGYTKYHKALTARFKELAQKGIFPTARSSCGREHGAY